MAEQAQKGVLLSDLMAMIAGGRKSAARTALENRIHQRAAMAYREARTRRESGNGKAAHE